MRIHRLEVEGFGPFRDLQVVDFDAFADEGIFLISGRTGAGKSSILDAVCFALYGNVPRYESGDKRLRSDHSEPDEPTRVSLEFSTGGARWRIERSPDYERAKRKGPGTTLQAAEARMFERVGDGWQGRAARAVDVGVLLDEILGLNQKQFLQVILLAQNRFARLLLAKNDERQELLRTLFGTRTFNEYEGAFEARRKDAGAALALENRSLLAHLEQAEGLAGDGAEADDAGLSEGDTADASGAEGSAVAEDLAARVARVARATLRARHFVETATAEEATAGSAHSAAERRHAEAVAQADKQQRRDRSRAALAELEARSPAIAADRIELAAARRAEELRASIDHARRALAAVATVDERERALRAAWVDGGEEDADTAGLDALASAVGRQIGEWSAALDAERGIPAEEAALGELERALAALQERRSDIIAQREEIPTRIAALDAAITAAALAAAVVPATAERVGELELRCAAAEEAVALTERVVAAERAALDAGKALSAASAALDSLRERRLAGYAGELAEALVGGEPCAVCGSTEHPSPAPRGGDPVTPADVAAADAGKAEALTVDAEATLTLRAAHDAAAVAAARAGGHELEQLEASLAEAREALATATDAAARASRLADDRDALADSLARLDAADAGVATELTVTVTAVAAATQALETARSAASAARGEFATVGERIAAAESRSDRALELAAATRDLTQKADAAAAAADDLGARLADSEFADAAAATAALRDAEARESLDARVREHESAIVAEKSALMQLELDIVPEEPIDTAVTAAELAAAAVVWSTAVAARAGAEQRAEALAAASARAEFAHDAIAVLAAEVAVIERLANTVAGRAPNTMRMKLETFVLAAELEEIVDAANLRLGEMSGDRYSLQHSDALAARGAASGLGLEVMDRFTGQARPAQSLSGGETFLASLALALGLAEVVTGRAGGITLDTLFIDEGFGALDAETLDVAMRTLDELRQGGRTVGVISHVEAMKEQLPAQLVVEVTPQGWSAIRQAVLAPGH